jgi:hypothetical protein
LPRVVGRAAEDRRDRIVCFKVSVPVRTVNPAGQKAAQERSKSVLIENLPAVWRLGDQQLACSPGFWLPASSVTSSNRQALSGEWKPKKAGEHILNLHHTASAELFGRRCSAARSLDSTTRQEAN